MGVYHLMGLGRSPGAVTGPLAYLGHRYTRWNEDDQAFFANSGEVARWKADQKEGHIQALVLFTTREVLLGKDEATGKDMLAYKYTDNQPGRTIGTDFPPAPMKQTLRNLLTKIWPEIAGEYRQGSLFWCEINRRDTQNVFRRVAQVVMALAGVGGQGKEMWMNLTGGNNITNFALQLSSSLSGKVARLYYIQAENQAAEKCVRHTSENDYWVNVPTMPLAMSRLNLTILELLTSLEEMSLENIWSFLQNDYWHLVQDLSQEEKGKTIFRERYLTPMWKQRLIAGDDDGYRLGMQWKFVQPYQEILEQAQKDSRSLETLAEDEPWIERELIEF